MNFVEYISNDKNRKLYFHGDYSILVSCSKYIAGKLYPPTISLVAQNMDAPRLLFDKNKKKICTSSFKSNNLDEMRKIIIVAEDLEKAILDNYDEITAFDEYLDAKTREYKKLSDL